MYYDLHIHSALSPCSDDDMSVNNIVNMAYIKNLDPIAITDHNSVKQLFLLDKIACHKIAFVYGVEIQTREEIHVLAYFLKDLDLKKIQEFLDMYLIEEPNDEDYFGHQYVYDENDNIKEIEPRLLIKSLDLSLKEVIDYIHKMKGVCVLAHVMSQRYSIMNIYMSIDEDIDCDGLEITELSQKQYLIHKYPYLLDKVWLMSSDAHRLEMILEPIHEISYDEFYGMWRKRYG